LLQIQDALGNLTTAGTRDTAGTITPSLDYRVLQPSLVMDANQNQAAAAFDALGMVVGTAVMGKPAPAPVEGDNLTGFTADLTDVVIAAHLGSPLTSPGDILQQATNRLVYDLFAYQRTQANPQPQPMVVYTLARETHVSDLAPNQTTQFQHAFSYSDGFGREVQKKVQADPGPVGAQPLVQPRWIGSGWTILNNKGKPVRQYEPFFSTTNQFEFANLVGVSPILFYDPLERVVATLHPNQTYEKVVFDPWEQDTWDANDTAVLDPAQPDPQQNPGLQDPDVAGYFSRLPSADYYPTWYGQYSGGSQAQQTAAANIVPHAQTPTLTYLDGLGRVFLTLADDGADANGNPQKFPTQIQLDIQGNQLSVTDAKGREVTQTDYGMLKNKIHQASMEAGAKWTVDDVAGKPFYIWTTNLQNYRFRQAYDALHRPTQYWFSQNSGTEALLQWMVYGEGAANALASNLLGKLYQSYDQGGLATVGAYDFKGNLLNGTREFASNYKPLNGNPYQVDWTPVSTGAASAASLLEKKNPTDAAPESFANSTTYDALNRPVTLTTPDNSVTQRSYNPTGLLSAVNVCLQGAQSAGSPSWTPFVTGITYNEKGQRLSIQYGNGAQTTYTYDPLTFRLEELLTTRPTPGSATGAIDTLQDLNYTYDPVGNIAEIDDNAQETLYFSNAKVTPNTQYTYDPLYRLTWASGREHIGQNQSWTQYDNWEDASDIGLPQPGDGNAMAVYQESYQYDQVGNFVSINHQATGNNWTRQYSCNEPSLLVAGQVSNRLSYTQAGGFTYNYKYDAHGNTVTMPHLFVMNWDCHDQLQVTSQQAVSGTVTPEMTYYVYDSSGQRIRKVTESQVADGQTPC
ncbi:MAG TPA: toxin, partial [bacterium]|nr:toxin [bacterium]